MLQRSASISTYSRPVSPGCTVNPLTTATFPALGGIARSKVIIDLTLSDDDESTSDGNAIETASNLPTYSPHVSLSSLQKPPEHTADDHTTPPAAATLDRKKLPWKNVPRWSPLYRKLQLHSSTPPHNPTTDTPHAGLESWGSTAPESSPNRVRALAVGQSEISPEISETPAIELGNIRYGQGYYIDSSPVDYNEATQATNGNLVIAGDSEEASLEIAESSEQPLAAATTSVSNFTPLNEDAPMIVDISELTMVRILDKQSNASGVKYKCKLEPLWLAADLVENARMGRVCIRDYENGLGRAGRLPRLRARKRRLSQRSSPVTHRRLSKTKRRRMAKKHKASSLNTLTYHGTSPIPPTTPGHSQIEVTVSDDSSSSYQLPSHQLGQPVVSVLSSIDWAEPVDFEPIHDNVI